MDTPSARAVHATVKNVHVEEGARSRRRGPGRAGRLALPCSSSARAQQPGTRPFGARLCKDQYLGRPLQRKPKAVVVFLHGSAGPGEQLEPWQAHLADADDVILIRATGSAARPERRTTSSARSAARSATSSRPKVAALTARPLASRQARGRSGAFPGAELVSLRSTRQIIRLRAADNLTLSRAPRASGCSSATRTRRRQPGSGSTAGDCCRTRFPTKQIHSAVIHETDSQRPYVGLRL